MKLLLILSAILALSLAEEDKKDIQEIEDSEAQAATVELLKEGVDLKAAASSYPYIPPSQREPWQPPQNTWEPPKQQQPAGNPWSQPPSNVQNDYYWSTGNPPHYHPTTTTTPVPVIKQEQYIGDRGDYRYEYQLGDGTHVGEQGYYTDPKQTDESVVKKGWYSFVGGDGVTYTVTWWADHTGYHAYGAHLPTPPPAPTAVQNNQPQHDYPVPSPTPQPAQPSQPAPTPAPLPVYPTYPTYVPSQPTYVPSQPSYVPSQPTYQPPQVPSYNPPQPTYKPPVYNPPQQYYPPQQTYYPQSQQTNYNV